MSKSNKNRDRRELVEQMRRQAKTKERRRTLAVVAVCLVVALTIIGLAVFKIVQDNKDAEALRKAPIADLGVSASAASCDKVKEDEATGAGDHVDGQKVLYKGHPPSFGPHWSNPAEDGIHKYTVDDRPEIERLVHNLEHGWTIVWYDETAAKDGAEMKAVDSLATKYDLQGSDPQYNLIIAPWTEADGPAMPEGKHITFTHWSVHGKWDEAKPDSFGESQYCGKFSGSVLADFTEKFPYDDAPEGSLWHQ